MATTQTPDFQTMRDRINQAWNTALTRADENRRRYITDVGYDSSALPSYTSQAARMARGQAPATVPMGNLQWTKNPYSMVSNLMRNGGDQKASLRNNFLQRGISGGIANQAEDQVDFATGGERLDFGKRFLAGMTGYDTGIADAAQSYTRGMQDVSQAEADWKLEQDYLQNKDKPKDAPPGTPPNTPPGNSPPVGTLQADALIKKWGKIDNPRKRLNAMYAFIRKNKGKIDPADLKMIQKMAASARRDVIGGTYGVMGNQTHDRLGEWNA